MRSIVLDLETQDLISKDFKATRISIAVSYEIEQDKYKVFRENEIHKLISDIFHADLVIGFNIIGFDYKLLQNYLDEDKNFDRVNTLDILIEIKKITGRRISLDKISKATLNLSKLGNGFKAIKFFKDGEFRKLVEYCKRDVELTYKIYKFGKDFGYILVPTGNNIDEVQKVNVNWA